MLRMLSNKFFDDLTIDISRTYPQVSFSVPTCADLINAHGILGNAVLLEVDGLVKYGRPPPSRDFDIISAVFKINGIGFFEIEWDTRGGAKNFTTYEFGGVSRDHDDRYDKFQDYLNSWPC